MKLKIVLPCLVMPLFVGAMNVPTNAAATVWWPEVKSINSPLSIYKDYDDPNHFYYIPSQIRVANSPDAVRMINHGLFFDRLHPSNSVSQYNLTFEPVLNDEDVQKAESDLRRENQNAFLTPLPVTTESFEVTEKFNPGDQLSIPFTVDVPHWTGDLHSFNQRFSVVMRGNLYSAEPAMSRFMTNPAGNAFAGTMHYGFRGVQRPFEGHAVVNVHQFVSKFMASTSARFGFWGSVDIATAIDKIKDDQSVFVDVKKDAGYESEVWKSLMEKLVSTLFQPVPPAPDAPTGSGGGLFQIKASYRQATREQTIKIDLREEITKDHSGDIDIVGGGIKPENLSQNLKYICDMWAVYDTKSKSCTDVCSPAVEYFDPTSKTCKPAFGSNN